MRRVTIPRRIATLAAVGLLVVTTASGTAAQEAAPLVSYEDAVPGVAPLGAAADAVYLDQAGNAIPTDTEPSDEDATSQAEVAALGCTPGSGRDNPHYSSGDVSGHGWWTKGTCTASTAHVYNCIYEYYTDNSWQQKDCSSPLKLTPGGGRGNRTTARANCDTTTSTSWRNHVDVDVDGQIDTGEKPMNQAIVACRVH